MNDELKQLIEDAAKLICLPTIRNHEGEETLLNYFNPLDPERGDLMKVARQAELWIDFKYPRVFSDYDDAKGIGFNPDDDQPLALAVLRAASAVWKARNGNAE